MGSNINKNFLGFESFDDFFGSLFGYKTIFFNAFIAFVAYLSSFITNFIWDSAGAVYTLWFIMCVDWFTGLSYAFKSKKYESWKNLRMPIYFVCTSLLLSMSWNMSKNSVIYYPLPSLVYGGFLAVYFSSVIENMSKLDWLPQKIAKLIDEKFGFKALYESRTKQQDKDVQ